MSPQVVFDTHVQQGAAESNRLYIFSAQERADHCLQRQKP